MPAKQKISDKQFLQALHINHGDFTATADHIQRKYKISYSRQAVYKRATAGFAAELRDSYLQELEAVNKRLTAMQKDEGCDARLRVMVIRHLDRKLNRLRKYATQ